jgi:hypothetical protein
MTYNNINPLKPSGNYIYIPSAFTFNNHTFCVYGFGKILSLNSDYFLKQC